MDRQNPACYLIVCKQIVPIMDNHPGKSDLIADPEQRKKGLPLSGQSPYFTFDGGQVTRP